MCKCPEAWKSSRCCFSVTGAHPGRMGRAGPTTLEEWAWARQALMKDMGKHGKALSRGQTWGNFPVALTSLRPMDWRGESWAAVRNPPTTATQQQENLTSDENLLCQICAGHWALLTGISQQPTGGVYNYFHSARAETDGLRSALRWPGSRRWWASESWRGPGLYDSKGQTLILNFRGWQTMAQGPNLARDLFCK